MWRASSTCAAFSVLMKVPKGFTSIKGTVTMPLMPLKSSCTSSRAPWTLTAPCAISYLAHAR